MEKYVRVTAFESRVQTLFYIKKCVTVTVKETVYVTLRGSGNEFVCTEIVRESFRKQAIYRRHDHSA